MGFGKASLFGARRDSNVSLVKNQKPKPLYLIQVGAFETADFMIICCQDTVLLKLSRWLCRGTRDSPLGGKPSEFHRIKKIYN